LLLVKLVVNETVFLHLVRNHNNRKVNALESGSIFKQTKFIPQSVFACFILFPQQTIISPHIIHSLFIRTVEIYRVLCEVRTASLQYSKDQVLSVTRSRVVNSKRSLRSRSVLDDVRISSKYV